MAMQKQFTVTATNFNLGAAGPYNIGTLVLQVTGTWTGSIAVKGRILSTTALPTPLVVADDVALGYTTPATSTPSTTAPTANGIFYYRVDGCLADVDVTVATGTGPILTWFVIDG